MPIKSPTFTMTCPPCSCCFVMLLWCRYDPACFYRWADTLIPVSQDDNSWSFNPALLAGSRSLWDFFFVCAHNRYENNQSLSCSSEETFQLKNNPPSTLFILLRQTHRTVNERTGLGWKAEVTLRHWAAPFVCHPFSSLVAATTHVPNHSFLVQLRADWLRAVHTPDTPPMKCLLRFLALAPGFSAWAIRGLHLYPTSVNP